jgi:sugar lactone lactonase YvrE
MYLSALTVLAIASGTALATPSPKSAPPAAKLPLPTRTIFQLGESVPGSWFENVALRPNGDLLVTMLQPNASVYSIEQPLSHSPKVTVISIGNANGTTGIAETSPDVFAIAAGLWSGLAVPVAGQQALWRLDMTGPEPITRLITAMPEAGLLNGVTGLPHGSSSPAVLVADSGLGLVWRVDLATGAYETAVQVPEMAAVPGHAAPTLGVNGVKARGGYLYFSNSNRASIFRVAIDATGRAAKGATAERVAEFDADNIDDFAIDERGDYWAATNFDDTVAVAKMDATGVVVVGSPSELTVAGDTALALGGRTKRDKDVVYVVTGGGQARPVNGTVTEPAKVVVVDRSGFK